MTAASIHLEQAPPRDSALPFLYSAPLALIVGGVLLVVWGRDALVTPWAAETLSLTHVMTLGFLSMAAVGLFAPLAAVAGDAPVPRPMTAHVVYWALVLGIAALTWGTAHAQAGAVFLAIGAISVMVVVFVWHGVVCLRGARARTQTLRALRVALWSFALAASLGVWLAHGHGGMLFPGPRGLWLGVHLSIALLGWIGGMQAAVWFEVLPQRLERSPIDERTAGWIVRGIGVGVTLPVIVLLAQYFGLIPVDAPWLPWLAGAALAPAVIAVWLVLPVAAHRQLGRRGDDRGRLLAGSSLWWGPLCLALGLAAAIHAGTSIQMLFGWTAIVGWAGFGTYACLVLVLPGVLAPAAPGPLGERASRVLGWGVAVHIGLVAAGFVAFVSAGGGTDIQARATGTLAIVDGALLLWLVSTRRSASTAS